MKITLLTVGKTDNNYLSEGLKVYLERLSHYIRFDFIEIQTPAKFKSLNTEQLKDAEGKLLLKYFETSDMVVLLDEKGKMQTSEEFAAWLQKIMNSGTRHLMFVVGGAFGFSQEVYKTSGGKLSLSPMTFSHQMVRLFFTEQLYRAFTILKNEPYHNS
ncbi:MAG: 23S rRNA (pseudouridine(1915)-N(3))-methyltransferase RlmH [Chloroflexota bacterium]|nr:23S rRNA (pseudouridine(1915)-N(3))-methyltransferase RlmH [Lentimicrobium sp.]